MSAWQTVTVERAMVERSERDEALKLVIDSARAAVDDEFRRAERLDAKARNQVTTGAAWFAAVQAFAVLAIRVLIDKSETSSWWYTGLILAATVTALLLGVSTWYGYQTWRLRTASLITQRGLEDMVNVAKTRRDELAEDIVTYYRHVLGVRRQANKEREQALSAAQFWWVAGLAAGAVELIAVIAALTQA